MTSSDFELPFLLIALSLTLIKGSQVASRKFGMPDVLGELIVGIILGPTVIGVLYLTEVPTSSLSGLLHMEQNQLDITALIINFISEFAVLLLLFKVGMEVNFDDLKKVKVPAFLTAGIGILLPIIAGFAFIYVCVDISSISLLPNGIPLSSAAIFFGATLTATSIGISTRLFLDLDKMKTKVAQTVVGAAIVDDIIAVSLFSVLIAYFGDTSEEASGVFVIFVKIVLFFLISYILFKYALPAFFRLTKGYSDKSVPVFVSIAFMLYMAVFATALGLAPIIGAFVAGVIVGNEDEYLNIEESFEPIASWIIPFFFLDIGLSINLISVINGRALLIALVLISLLFISKYIAGNLGTRFLDYDNGESHTVGLSMVARGEVTLIFAFEGYALGYFSEQFYGIIILSVVLLTFILIPILKNSIKNKVPDANSIGGNS